MREKKGVRERKGEGEKETWQNLTDFYWCFIIDWQNKVGKIISWFKKSKQNLTILDQIETHKNFANYTFLSMTKP